MKTNAEIKKIYLNEMKKLYLAYLNSNSNRLFYIELDISGNCNLNCEMCSFQKWYKNRGQMSLETVKNLDKVFCKLIYVGLSCNCEPLLNKDIIKIIRFIRRKNKNIFISLFTNGTLLNVRLISRLLKNGLNRIYISIDSPIKENYEKIRKGACFDVVINNVKELVSQRKYSKNSLKEIGISTVASKENAYELEGILDLAKKLGVDSFSVLGLEPRSRELVDKILYGKKINNKFKKIFLKLKQKSAKYNIKLYLPSLKIILYKSCILKKCLIDWNGDVHPCGLLAYKREYYYLGKRFIHPKITFGNINNHELLDIWNSKGFKKFRENISSGKIPSYCKTCLFNNKVLCVT